MVKIFIDTDENRLEEKINKWLSENKMEVDKISFSHRKERFGCAIVCTSIHHGF